MAITQKTRWIIISTALILTLVAVIQVNQTDTTDDAQVSIPEPRHTSHSRHVEDDAKLDPIALEKLQRTQAGAKVKIADLFTSKSWYVPPPPPKPMPPPPPMAPPLPFTYIGELMEDGEITVFLSKQDRNYVIKTDTVIDGTYHVDTITPTVLTLTYLPLKIKQSMPLGDSH
jgi:hypothetical protein